MHKKNDMSQGMTRKQFDHLIDLLGVNQKELAQMLGINPATISRWHERCNYPSWLQEWVLGRMCIKRYKEGLINQDKKAPRGI